MKEELEESIAYLESLKAAGDEKMGALIDRQLSKLGDIENVASSLEGVVFKYNGKIYKITGAFAMVNQIIGRARRAKPRDTSEAMSLSENFIRSFIRESLIRGYSKL